MGELSSKNREELSAIRKLKGIQDAFLEISKEADLIATGNEDLYQPFNAKLVKETLANFNKLDAKAVQVAWNTLWSLGLNDTEAGMRYRDFVLEKLNYIPQIADAVESLNTMITGRASIKLSFPKMTVRSITEITPISRRYALGLIESIGANGLADILFEPEEEPEPEAAPAAAAAAPAPGRAQSVLRGSVAAAAGGGAAMGGGGGAAPPPPPERPRSGAEIVRVMKVLDEGRVPLEDIPIADRVLYVRHKLLERQPGLYSQRLAGIETPGTLPHLVARRVFEDNYKANPRYRTTTPKAFADLFEIIYADYKSRGIGKKK